jgi:hypothetical protein
MDTGRATGVEADALRVARFGNANEHSDWETAHHVFTYANALHAMLGRTDPLPPTSRQFAASSTARSLSI